MLKFRESLLGPQEDIVPDDPLNGTAFERAGHCKGIGGNTRAYNLGISLEQATQLSAPAAQGKGRVGDLAQGVKLRQGAIRVCCCFFPTIFFILVRSNILVCCGRRDVLFEEVTWEVA